MKPCILGLLVLTLVWSGCNSSKTVSASADSAAAVRAPENLPAPVTSPPADAIVASGPIVVENQLDVEALRDGVVTAILVQPDTPVRKGQLLAKLDDRQISADIDAAAAHVRALEDNVENWKAETKVLQADRSRAEILYSDQVIAKEELDHAVYKEQADEYEVKRESESLNNARDVLRSLQLEKEKTNVSAPFDGVVARRYVRVGQKVAVGDRLFWVTAMAPLQVRFTLPERYFGKVRDGMMLTVSSADISPDSRYSARIVQVSPVVDPSSGTLEVLAQIAEAKTELRPGMLVNIAFNQHP
jgi:membrane fusion protein, multidrug efflux system